MYKPRWASSRADVHGMPAINCYSLLWSTESRDLWYKAVKQRETLPDPMVRHWRGIRNRKSGVRRGNGMAFFRCSFSAHRRFENQYVRRLNPLRPLARPALQNKEQAQPDFHSSGERDHWHAPCSGRNLASGTLSECVNGRTYKTKMEIWHCTRLAPGRGELAKGLRGARLRRLWF